MPPPSSVLRPLLALLIVLPLALAEHQQHHHHQQQQQQDPLGFDFQDAVRELLNGPMDPKDLRQRVTEVYPSLSDAFAMWDATSVGLDAALHENPLTRKDFVEGAASLSRPLSEAQSNDVFDSLDTNENDEIDRNEFVGALSSGTYGPKAPTTRAPATHSASTSSTTVAATTTTQAAAPAVGVGGAGVALSSSTMTTLSPSSTVTTTSTSTTVVPSLALYNEDVIHASDLKERILSNYDTLQEAFAAMNQNPAPYSAFWVLTRTLRKPLTDRESRYAFRGLDADGDELLIPAEFLQILEFGDFFPDDGMKILLFVEGFKPETPVALEHLQNGKTTGNEFLLALACSVGTGYLARTLFVALRLPGSVGVLLAGFLFARLLPKGLLSLRNQAEEAAVFILIFSTGFEVCRPRLNRNVPLLSLIPATFELLTLVLYTCWGLNFRALEAWSLALALFSVSDGALAPKLHELGARFRENPILRQARQASGFEVVLGTCLLGCLLSFSSSMNGRPGTPTFGGFLSCLIRIALSLGVGAAVGYICSKGVQFWNYLHDPDDSPINGSILVVFCALLTMGLGSNFLAVSSTWQPALQSELLALSSGIAFAAMSHASAAERGERLFCDDALLGGLSTLAQLLLLWTAGATTTITAVAAHLVPTLKLALFGLAARSVGVVMALLATARTRGCACSVCERCGQESFLQDALFLLLCGLPRGTFQCSVASEALLSRLLPSAGAGTFAAAELLAVSARLHTVILSVVGYLALDCLGPRLLTLARCGCALSRMDEERWAASGWTAFKQYPPGSRIPRSPLRFGLLSEDGVVYQYTDAPAYPPEEAVRTLAKWYHLDANELLAGLEEDFPENDAAVEQGYRRLGSKARFHQLPLRFRRTCPPRTLPAAAVFDYAGSWYSIGNTDDDNVDKENIGLTDGHKNPLVEPEEGSQRRHSKLSPHPDDLSRYHPVRL